MTTTTHDRRTRPTDAAPDPHDRRTCPTCRERPLTEDELVEAYGIRNHDLIAAASGDDDAADESIGGVL